jgi:hypothetical protein
MISQNNKEEKQLSTTVNNFFKTFKIGDILKQCNFYKDKGFPPLLVLKFLFTLVFSAKNLYRYLQSNTTENLFGKDVVYRFLNSTSFNWLKFLFLLSQKVIKTHLYSLTSDDRENVLIVDDSFYSRERSKSVELLARVRDNADNGRYKKGFRMLTLGWSDGNTFIPLNFTLLSSANKKNRLYHANESIDKRSNGYKRRASSLLKMTDAMLELIKQAVKYKIPAKYVLFDSWFTYPSILRKILQFDMHTIAMVKAMPNVYYTFNGKTKNLKDIYASVKKRRGKAKILSSVVVGIGIDCNGKEIFAKIVFVRDRNRSRKWLALISTDISMDDEEIVRIYGKRWDIEVFFKMCKSYLSLAKEFQSRSYDSMIAHTTIVFSRYIMLAVENRNNTDLRTVGALFYHCCDELQDIQFIEAIQLIIDILKNALQQKLMISKEQISEFIDYFINALPVFLKEKLSLLFCES